MKRLLIIFAIGSFSTLQAAEYDTIHVSDFGLRPDTRENSTLKLKEALFHAKKFSNPMLVFEKGRYDFWPQYSDEKEYFESNTTDINPKRLAILIEGFQQLVLDGNGADFVFHDRMQPVTVDNSSNIKIRNFTVDWDIPLTAQAEVMEIEDDFIVLKINKLESPYIIENDQLVFVGEGWKSGFWGVMEIERISRLIAPNTGDRGCCGRGWDQSKAEELSQGLVKIHKPFGERRPEKGNFLILRHNQRDHAGMFLFHSKNIEIENVSIFHTAGLGILSQFSENISMDRVKMIPNPAKNRYLSGHDDGFHFSNCKGQINVTNCEFAALMDDPINIHGTSVRIIKKVNDKTLRCRFMHHQTVGLQWTREGEKIGFIQSKSMETISFGVVDQFEPWSKTDFDVSFKEGIPSEIHEGDALENLTWTPDAHISDNKFMSCRARGVLVSTPGKVVIERNYFESSGSAILIAGDANNWYETGAVKDVTIQGNVFAAPCLTSMYQFSEAIISIFPEIPDMQMAKSPYHKNIRIKDNEFHPFDYPILYAKSVDGLVFKGNKLSRSHDFTPFHSNKHTFSLEYCRNVEVSDNEFFGDILGKNARLTGMKKRDISMDKNQHIQMEFIKP